ncbi:hypothetical protein YWS52_21240 [Chitiniphilus shinanonensis]
MVGATAQNSPWFTGKPFEDKIGLSYYGARWYDPTLGRFMAMDPVNWVAGNPVHSFNRYGYANSNPLKFIDPDGREAKTDMMTGPSVMGPHFGMGQSSPSISEAIGSYYQSHEYVPGHQLSLAESFVLGLIPGVDFITAQTPADYAIAAIGLIPIGKLVKPAKAIWSATKSKSAVKNAYSHWTKHKGEFPELQNAKQYVEAENKFVTNPSVDVAVKTRSNGDTMLYSASTNTFAVKNYDDLPRTMFRPAEGASYWSAQ